MARACARWAPLNALLQPSCAVCVRPWAAGESILWGKNSRGVSVLQMWQLDSPQAWLLLAVMQIWGEEALQFQEKLLNSSGLGDETYFPDSEHFLPGPTPTNGQAIAVWHPFLNYQASWGCQPGPCNNTRRQQGSGVWCKGLRLMLRRCSPGV